MDRPTDALLHTLPLVTLYLTERCNSRCVSCDYWRHGRDEMTLPDIERWLPGLQALGTRVVQLSGGEPLLHPQWQAIAQRLRDSGLGVWLLTAGLSLAKEAAAAVERFDSITVSMDGTCRATYAAIRGVDAFDKVCEGIARAAQLGRPPGLRVTLQRANYRELPGFVALARKLGARSVSFLAADVSNPHAFGRQLLGGFASDIALQVPDLVELGALLDTMAREHAADFASGYIVESPAKLGRILDYYRATCGLGEFPEVRCNAPEFSAVIEAGGRLRPCFFIPGPGTRAGSDLAAALNEAPLARLRGEIRGQRRPECARCVCSMWRDPAQAAAWAVTA